MPPAPPTQQMGEKHEEYLAGVNAGRKSKASGSQWSDPADGRNGHDEPYALAWDGKSTLGKSIAVTLETLRKIREQALGEIPEIGLRWYANQSLRDVLEDWVAVPGDDWKNILSSARSWRALSEWLLEHAPGSLSPAADDEDVAVFLRSAVARLAPADSLRASLAEAHGALVSAGETIAAQRRELEAMRSLQQVPDQQSRPVPRLPWTVVHLKPLEPGWWAEEAVGVSVYHQPDGMQAPSLVRSVRVQRSMTGRPHLFADNMRLRNADLYDREGRLQARVCEDDPSIEVG